jgi:hypothetical protein
MARALTTIVVVASALVLAGPAHAVGGNYFFEGGTPKQHAQVRAALNASAFDWDVVPARIAIHIVRSPRTYAYRGHIVLDARLVDSGPYGWAYIQHEYAHQVDFFLFGPRTRERLQRLLGGKEWFSSATGSHHEHHEYGSERFASTLTWAYWPSRNNALRPRTPRDESAAMEPAGFRQLMAGLLRSPRLASR